MIKMFGANLFGKFMTMLFRELREFDEKGIKTVYAEFVYDEDYGLAVDAHAAHGFNLRLDHAGCTKDRSLVAVSIATQLVEIQIAIVGCDQIFISIRHAVQ